jgi:hypothetical protein
VAGGAQDVLARAARQRHATGEPVGERERLERRLRRLDGGRPPTRARFLCFPQI